MIIYKDEPVYDITSLIHIFCSLNYKLSKCIENPRINIYIDIVDKTLNMYSNFKKEPNNVFELYEFSKEEQEDILFGMYRNCYSTPPDIQRVYLVILNSNSSKYICGYIHMMKLSPTFYDASEIQEFLNNYETIITRLYDEYMYNCMIRE